MYNTSVKRRRNVQQIDHARTKFDIHSWLCIPFSVLSPGRKVAFHDIRKLVRFATKMPHVATTKCPHEYFIRSILARLFMRNMFNEANFFRKDL